MSTERFAYMFLREKSRSVCYWSFIPNKPIHIVVFLEYSSQQSVQQNKVVTTFLDLLSTSSNDTTQQKNQHTVGKEDEDTNKSTLLFFCVNIIRRMYSY